MTREEAIKRWEAIIPTVFRAEKAIRPRLLEVLTEHEDDPTTGAELEDRRTKEMRCQTAKLSLPGPP